MKKFSLQFLFTILLILLMDFFFGAKFIPDEKDNARHRHEIFGFNLKPNITKTYIFSNADSKDNKITFCTDRNGFRVACNKKNLDFDEINYDIVILGDSIAEGTGVEYNKTFSGFLEKRHNQKVLNLGVNGYSFSNYYSKINYYLNQGLITNRVVMTISSVNDWLQYNNEFSLNFEDTKNPKVIWNESFKGKKNFKTMLKNIFPLSYFSLWKIKNYFFPFKDKGIVLKNLENLRKFDYVNFNSKHPAFSLLDKMNELFSEKDINFYIVIFPSPGNFFINNQQYISTMKEYCLKKECILINLFDNFLNVSNYKEYYLINDDHFNIKGHKYVSDEIIKNLN